MDLTVVLVGPTGHGKSATGNTILGREAFISTAHSSRVTQTCELQTSVLKDGRTISVIDTPGFVDIESELPGEEVEKCMNLARNRIHAFLFVVSKGQRISAEDQTVAVRKLKRIFGENIVNCMILVFTHPEPNDINSDIIDLCQRRYVFFYNKTKDEERKSKQVQYLLSEVKTLMSNNGGKPFMSHVLQAESTERDATTTLEQRLVEMQATMMNVNKEQIIDAVEARLRDTTTRLEQRLVEMQATTMNANKEQMTQIIDVVEARLRDTTTSLKQQMEAATLKADERAEKYFKEATSELIQQMTQRINEVVSSVKDVTTRLEQQLAEAELKADERAQEAQKNSDDQIQMLKEVLERAESRVKDVTSRLEQQLAEAEAARLKADERAQEAQKPYWRFGVKPFICMFMLILLLLWDQYRQTYSNVK